MNPITMFLILALLAAIWWLVRKRRESTREAPVSRARPKSTSTQFHAVSIQYSGKACQAAIDMSGRRFLATAAPRLPLPDCDMLECNCRFSHHDDRRSHKDRPATASYRERSNQFRLLRCAKTHRQCRFVQGFS